MIRLVVVNQLPQEENNALLHLFSARMDQVRFGAAHYRLRSPETSTVLLQLFERYRLEVFMMPDMLEQFAEETINELVRKLPAEKVLKGRSAEEIWAALSPENRAALAQMLKDDDLPQKANESEQK